MKRDKNELLIDGVLLVDKPQEWTSHDVCAFVKKRFRIHKVGHAGTLDPMATGLLVLLLGRATKDSNSLMSCDKEYEGVMQLGLQTDSHDRTGKVLSEKPAEDIEIADVQEKAKLFTGTIQQVPPMVSAIKHKGVRLYKLARQGKEVELEGLEVLVHSFEIQKKDGQFISFASNVSKGTYVRTLVHDLGEALGCGATLYDLRRRRSGNFDVSRSVTIDELKNMDAAALRQKVQPLGSYACSQ